MYIDTTQLHKWNTLLTSVNDMVEYHNMGTDAIYTEQWRYNVVKFLQNIHKRHPIPHPLGRGMGCLLRFQTLIICLRSYNGVCNTMLYWIVL